MSRRIRWCLGTVMAVFAAACGVAWLWLRVSPEAAALRERFPYVSLTKRLGFEAVRRVPNGEQREPKLLETARERLETSEQGFWMFENARMESLQKLHSSAATRFVNSPGNGLSRFGRRPSPAWLDYEEPGPISFPADLAASAEEREGEPVVLNEKELEEQPGGAWMPSLKLLGDFHSRSNWSFVSAWSVGHVIDRDHVAGFVPHAFSELPILAHPDSRTEWSEPDRNRIETRPQRWTIERLDLVSLLKFDEPAVYLSDHLPRMSELVAARTRPLSAFETQALESLRGGEYLVAAAETNQIQMLGSLRATKHCLECHSVSRGSLLGAFSYRLRRDPPLSVIAPGEPPST